MIRIAGIIRKGGEGGAGGEPAGEGAARAVRAQDRDQSVLEIGAVRHGQGHSRGKGPRQGAADGDEVLGVGRSGGTGCTDVPCRGEGEKKKDTPALL